MPDTVTSADGSALVKLGNTTVVCGVKLEVGKPQDTSPKDGRLGVFGLAFARHCSRSCGSTSHTALFIQIYNWPRNRSVGQRWRVAHIAFDQVFVSVFVSQMSSCSTRVLSLDDLCIVEGKSAWVLYADILCLDYDGCVLDAALLALVAALKSGIAFGRLLLMWYLVRLPAPEVDESTGEVVIDVCPCLVHLCMQSLVEGRECKRLRIGHTPIPLTFGLLDECDCCMCSLDAG